MNIVLIGLRGSGKTTVGKVLAQKLNRELAEMDELIVSKAGMSIPDIVSRQGWESLRDIEEEMVIELAERDNIINASGGGVVVREQNIGRLRQNGIVVWLTARAKTLLERIGDDPNRPLLKGKTQLEDMEIAVAERGPLYRKAADIIINTENKQPEEVAAAIIHLIIMNAEGIINRLGTEKTAMAKAATRTCCLIGDPVEHSLSPLIHNTAYQALGIDYTYITLPSRDIGQALAEIREQGIRGASVTIPHKVSVMDYLDRIDPDAQAIGAVNTIVNDNGLLTGYNTDGWGALQALEEVTSPDGKKVVLIGSGGAARAIAATLKKKDVNLTILNRTEAKAQQLAERVGAAGFGGLEKLPLLAESDILINATSVGMAPQTGETIVPRQFLHPRLTVLDVVYNPKETRLLRESREKGCNIVYGYKMLLYQAALQFRLFTGHPAPLRVMESALTKALGGG